MYGEGPVIHGGGVTHGGGVIHGGGLISFWRWRSDWTRALIIRGGGVLPGEGVLFEKIDPRWSSLIMRLCTAVCRLTATISRPLCAVFQNSFRKTVCLSKHF